MLCPETQDLESFVDGIDNICEAQQRVALGYFEDGSIDDACPPLQALLHIMAHGHYQGKGVDDPAVRAMFSRDYLLQSDWYRERLRIKQQRDVRLWNQHSEYLRVQKQNLDEDEVQRHASIDKRLAEAERMIGIVSSSDYLQRLEGTLGADWIHRTD